MKTTKVTLGILLGLLCGFTTFASEGGLKLLDFRLGGIAYFQSGGNCYTGILNWAPSHQFSESFGLQLSVGPSLIKTKAETLAPMLEAMIFPSFSLSKQWSIEVGGGMQLFVNNGDRQWALHGNGIYQLESPWIGVVKYLQVGYTYAMIPTLPTHELRAGVGIVF